MNIQAAPSNDFKVVNYALECQKEGNYEIVLSSALSLNAVENPTKTAFCISGIELKGSSLKGRFYCTTLNTSLSSSTSREISQNKGAIGETRYSFYMRPKDSISFILTYSLPNQSWDIRLKGTTGFYITRY